MYLKNKKIKISLILILLAHVTFAWEIGINNHGIEFGLNGKQHFKLLAGLECYHLLYDKGLFYSVSVQWLNIGTNQFRFKFLSAFSQEFWYYERVSLIYNDDGSYINDFKISGDNLNRWIINIVDFEPEIFINEHSSIYLRGNLFCYSLTYGSVVGIFAKGSHDDNNIPVLVGLRYRF